MITIVFLIGCFLTFLFLMKKRKIEEYNWKKGALYYFYKNSLEFLVPFVVITFLYLMLSLVVAVASNSATLHYLIRFEQSIEKLKAFFSIFKLNAIEALIVLVALYLLGFFRFPAQKSKKIFSLFDKYQLLVRRVYIVLVLLCSFTFFGTQLGEPTKNLRLHIKTIREGYADLSKDVQDTIAEEVAIGLYPKVYDQFPQSYQNAFELPAKIEQETKALRDYYNSVRTEFGTENRNIEVMLERGSLRTKTALNLESEINFPDAVQKRRYYFVIPDPHQTSYKKVENAKTALGKYRYRQQSRFINLLQIEGGKQVTTQIPKVFTGEAKKALFQQFINEYPILEPIVDVFFKTLDNGIETNVEKVVERVTNATITNPENVGKLISEEMANIVQQKTVSIPAAILKQSDQVAKQLTKELANIKNARLKVDRLLNTGVFDLIAQLSSTNEDVRTKASDKLSNMGEKLTESQVKMIVNIMRFDQAKWSRFLYRESHCRWFEYTSVKYYAANALINMQSQYVNNEIKKEARNAKTNGRTRKRVTDPGWI